MQTSFRLALILLGPLLYAQGRYVRWRIPKLPEANGERSGVSGEGKPLSLLILGDSAAAGVGVIDQAQALSGQVQDALSQRYRVHWTLEATTGHQSRDVITHLSQHPASKADAVLVSIGVNDVNGLVSSRHWSERLQRLTSLIKEQTGARKIIFSSLPPMHRFPALPQPLRWWLGSRAKHFNALLQNFCEQQSRCQFAEIPYTPADDLIAADGFHPGEKAYALWGDYAAELIAEQMVA